MPKLKIFLISLIILIVGVGIIAVLSFLYIQNSIENNFGESWTVKEFAIEQGEGVKSISQRLEDEGLISSEFVFRIYIWQKGLESRLQAGEYEIPTGINMPKILNMLTGGDVKRDTVWVTIPEGYNSQQIAERITNYLPAFATQEALQAGELRITNFSNIINNSSAEVFTSKYWFLQKGHSLEGFLFPDTYEFSREATGEEIIEKMLDNFDSKVSPLKSQIENNRMSLYEILTLASIVEKEVSSVEDMKIVSGLFLKRLEIGMFLQSDATINYITNKGMPSPLYKDLEVDSPYNTYKYAGLPPGQICNPGLNAIKAVLDPIKTDYLYFLTPPGKPTVYSKTFEEHNANKIKWLK